MFRLEGENAALRAELALADGGSAAMAAVAACTSAEADDADRLTQVIVVRRAADETEHVETERCARRTPSPLLSLQSAQHHMSVVSSLTYSPSLPLCVNATPRQLPPAS